MEWHDYVTCELIKEHLAELREHAARERQIAAHRPPRPPLRAAVGGALIRLGSWMVGAEPEKRLDASYRRA